MAQILKLNQVSITAKCVCLMTKGKREDLKPMHTWRVRALVCFVTKKLVKFTKYARAELNSRYQTIFISSLASASVIPTTFSSIKSVAGSKNTTAIGAMYKSRFIEFSFSLE